MAVHCHALAHASVARASGRYQGALVAAFGPWAGGRRAVVGGEGQVAADRSHRDDFNELDV